MEKGRITSMVYNTHTLTEAGENLLVSPLAVSLPKLEISGPTHTSNVLNKETPAAATKKLTRKSKGTHLLPMLTKLLSSSENWYNIQDPEDYQYPGKFQHDYPQRLGFAADITTLPFYTDEDEHFLFNDIQIGKGKPRQPRKVMFNMDGTKEELFYRIAPCGGIKQGLHSCFSREHQPCPHHAEAQLKTSRECPVEFVYVWSVNNKDKRRWLSGIIRTGDLEQSILHNHPLHGPTKVPSKIVHDIKQALEKDPTLKTHDIMTG